MYRGNIFWDFDETMFKTLELLVLYMNQKYDIKSTIEDYSEHPYLDAVIAKYRPEGPVPTRGEVYEDLASEFLNSREWHDQMDPVDGLLDILPMLSEDFDNHIVTAREFNAGPTMRWLLRKHEILQYIEGMHYVWVHLGNQNFKGTPKIDLIKRVPGKAILFIDDAPKEIIPVAGYVNASLYDPRGNHVGRKDIKHRIESLREIPKIIYETEIKIQV
ncbi:hypothetical protein GW765_01585 [Candidatus Parcubacteria bacterium]|nr:hypothetical protein [Candidatus Parcubacteria bacterium]